MGSLHATCSLAKCMCKVDVSFCHNGLVKRWKLADHLRHGLFQQVLLFTLLYVFFTEGSHTVQNGSEWWKKKKRKIQHSQNRNGKFQNGMKHASVLKE